VLESCALIAVASGKGGVGKSTVSVNLAASMAAEGAAVGLLDADIYGPSIPQMMGAQGPLEQNDEGLIKPLVSHGVRLVSVGFISGQSDAIIYRGPLVGKMVKRFIGEVDWGELDYLFIDLPPGTGDASLALAQAAPLSGAVIVTTPQQVALSDVRRCITMFQRLKVPILGIVENMSYFVAPGSGERTHIFGNGGGRLAAAELDLHFLGDIPIDPSVCAAGDSGQPVVMGDMETSASRSFAELADKIAERARNIGDRDPPPIEVS